MRVLSRLLIRRLTGHPWQLFLGVLGIALGVGIVLAIDLTNASALRAFEISSKSMLSGFTHEIISDSSGIDESLYRDLRTRLGLHKLLPIVEGEVTGSNHETYRLFGIDPISMMGSDVPGLSGTHSNSMLRLLTEPDSAFITESTRAKLNLNAPGRFTVYFNGRRQTLNIIGILPDRGGIPGQLLQSSFLSDIATAQDLLGMQGKLSRIDLNLEGSQIEQVKGMLHQPQQLIRSETPVHAIDRMTRAFHINLTALSLLALVIGAFLIYNTMTISVLQRREQFAILKVMGTDHVEIFLLVMAEALILAALGILSGYGLGIGLSKFLIKLSSRTLTDLYFIHEVQHLYINGWSLIKATALGLGGVLVAAYIPARDAMTTVPMLVHSRSVLEARARSVHGSLFKYSLASASIALLILVFTDRSIIAGFIALFFIIIAFALASPLLLVVLVRWFKPVLEPLMGLLGSIAARGVLASLSRTQIAVTALAVSISATIGVSIMIGSFRHSVEIWLANYLKADVYISPVVRGGEYGVDDALLMKIRSLTGIKKVTTTYYRNIWQDEQPIRLRVVDIDRQVLAGYPFKKDGTSDRWSEFSSGDGVVISEPYAWHHGLKTGDYIKLITAAGARRFQVEGIYVDYGSDQGVITMHRDIYTRYWGDAGVSSVSIYTDKSLNAGELAQRLNMGLLEGTNLHARANRDLRSLSMKIFDRTFSITQVLRILTVIIAVIGILGALMSIQLERNREFAILRANGLTPGGLRQLVLAESGLMGVCAGLIAVPLGIVLAAVLIFIINRRSFGWSMEFLLEPGYLAGAVLLGLFAGVLAGLYPAWRVAGVQPVAALRDE